MAPHGRDFGDSMRRIAPLRVDEDCPFGFNCIGVEIRGRSRCQAFTKGNVELSIVWKSLSVYRKSIALIIRSERGGVLSWTLDTEVVSQSVSNNKYIVRKNMSNRKK